MTVTLALAGCGGSGARPHPVAVGSYGGFGATTISGQYSAKACADDGRVFVREARLFLARQGKGYPADLYYMNLRIPVADFEARGCKPSALGIPLLRRMTAAQRHRLVADLPAAMGQLVQNAEQSH